MTAPQGWDRADYSCGRCPRRLSAATEEAYIFGTQVHLSAHAMVDLMSGALKQETHAILRHDLAGPQG